MTVKELKTILDVVNDEVLVVVNSGSFFDFKSPKIDKILVLEISKRDYQLTQRVSIGKAAILLH